MKKWSAENSEEAAERRAARECARENRAVAPRLNELLDATQPVVVNGEQTVEEGRV